MTIKQMLQSGQPIAITVSATDLAEFGRTLIDEGREMEREAAKRRADYDKTGGRELTKAEVAEQLRVTPATLCRWRRTGYLKPHAYIGVRPMYLQEQVDEIKKKRTL